MLLAEEFDFLRNKQILRVMLALALKGPLTKKEFRKLGLGKPYRIKQTLDYLEDEGKIIKVKRVLKRKSKPPLVFVQYFMADEFIAAALAECCAMLERSHRAYADGFKRLAGELRPLF